MNENSKKTATELKKLIKLMKKQGVLSLKIEGVEVTLAPDALKEKKRAAEKVAEPNTVERPIYSEVEALFWSSDGVPDENTTEEATH